VFIYLLALAVGEAVCCKMGGCVMNGLERDVMRSSCGLVQRPGTITIAVGRTDKFDVWLTVHCSSMWNKKPTKCHLVLYLFLLIVAQHVSGHLVPIFRS